MLGLASTAIGMIGGAIGAAVGSNAASKRKKKLGDLANVAAQGVDYGAITQESLKGIQSAFPTATAIGQQYNDYYSNEMNRLMESVYPGWAEQKGKYSAMTGSLMAGEIPSDVQSQVFRSAAGKSLFGGFGGGSGLQRNLTARDLGTTSLGLMQTGAGMLSNARSAFGTPQVYDVSQLTGLTPTQQIGYEQQNLQNYLNLKGQQIGAQGSGDVWASYLANMGGALAGGGITSMLGGGGGGGTSSYVQPQYNSAGVQYGSANAGASLGSPWIAPSVNPYTSNVGAFNLGAPGLTYSGR